MDKVNNSGPLAAKNGAAPEPQVVSTDIVRDEILVPDQVGPPQVEGPPEDFPVPAVLRDHHEFEWDELVAPAENYRGLGLALNKSGDLFRFSQYAGGLCLASPVASIPVVPIRDQNTLAAVLADRVRVLVKKGGRVKSTVVPARHLDVMLRTECFLQAFRPIDQVSRSPRYLPDFRLAVPGYNDGGAGQRILYLGREAQINDSSPALTAFLGVMSFASNSDRTNAVALALTVLLRNFWPGAKPVGIITSSKSHGGKETVVTFAAGSTPIVSVDYQVTDWAFRQGLVAGLESCPEAGLVNIENARLGRSDTLVASATLERILTNPEPTIHSSKVRKAVKFKNYLVFTITTNYGSVSDDMMNRGLPVHLNPVGNVADRESPIGNPMLEYLPKNREQIEAELRGFVEKWKAAGCPLDVNVRHPFRDWSRTVGGILLANGFTDFLGNYAFRKTCDEPVRAGLGLLGAARPDEWLRARTWAELATDLGVVKAVVPKADQDSDKGRERGIGVVLSSHREERFQVETEDKRMTLVLKKRRARFQGAAEPTTCYKFEVEHTADVPEDAENLMPRTGGYRQQ
jgi:hypothetical protein